MRLDIYLQPKQKLFLATVEQVKITFYGGAKGGGKSKGVRDIMLLRRFQYGKTHGALFRRTYKELEGNHIRPLFKEYPELKKFWNESKKLLTLPNGSTLEFCHCENENDVSLYQGREFEDLAIEEAGQWTESMFRTLLGSNRSSVPGFKPRCLLTGNPGGVGHGWLKRIFVDRRFTPLERPQDYAFVKALVDDNPALIHNDPDYVHLLNSQPNEALRKAYRDGDWDVFAGQFFGEIRKDIHLIPAFNIPPHWNKFGAYDYGFNHPAAFGWFANDEDGNVYLYREFVKNQLRVDQQVAHIASFDDTKDLQYIVAGHDCWAKRTHTINVHQGQNPPTVAEEFQTGGMYLKQAIIDRIQGAAQMRKYLAWQNRPPANKPRFYIFDTCRITFDTIAKMIFDPDRPEDVLKMDATDGDPLSGDDAYDMCRYGLMSRPILSDPKHVPIVVGTKAWQDKQNERIWEIERERLEKEQNTEATWPVEPGFSDPY